MKIMKTYNVKLKTFTLKVKAQNENMASGIARKQTGMVPLQITEVKNGWFAGVAFFLSMFATAYFFFRVLSEG